MERALRMTGSLAPRGAWSADRCTIAKALDVIPTRSAFLILREAFYGTTRFDDFAQRVGISEPVTAARLKELVDNGLLEREHVCAYVPYAARWPYEVHLAMLGHRASLLDLGAAEVREKFGVGPDKVIDVQALCGDSVDNPGHARGGHRHAPALGTARRRLALVRTESGGV